MALETRTKVIDSLNISVQQFPATIAWKIQVKLIKLFGPSIGAVMGDFDLDSYNLKDTNSIAMSVEKLVNELDPDDSLKLIFELCSFTWVNDKEFQNIFDKEFAGKLIIVYKIVAFVLEVNYGNFLAQSGILGSLAKALKSKTIPQEEEK